MYRVLIQNVARTHYAPGVTFLRTCAKLALAHETINAEMTIRIVGTKEIIRLNSTYRHKTYATNVLSFPFEMTDDFQLDMPLLGDLVICAQVVNDEAKRQNKIADLHWAHMVVHGTLHLLGHDHEQALDAQKMESKEIEIMQLLGFSNPYA